tara:strand:+ start:892 stop:1221 length:330 start_codon:yes stop_codon:yes gene_type:complete
MSAHAFIDLIGYAAGSVICVSTLPQILRLCRNPEQGIAESIPRNVMIAAGNALWFVYGMMTSATAIAVMCVIGVVLNGIVLGFALKANRDGVCLATTNTAHDGGQASPG